MNKFNKIALFAAALLTITACGNKPETEQKPGGDETVDPNPGGDGNKPEVEKTGTVSIKASANGKVTASKLEGKVGDKITLIPKGDEGYELNTLKANGNVLTAENGTYSFILIEGTNEVEATFKAIEVVKTGTVVIAQTEHGSVTPSITAGKVGTVVTLIVTAHNNFEIDEVKANDTVLTPNEHGTYTFALIEGTNNVVATFKEKQVEVKTGTVSLATSENGTIVADKTSGNVGDTITLTVAPNDGYKVTAVVANGAIIQQTEGGKYTFVLKEGINEVSATFELIEAVDPTLKTGTVTIADAPHGQVKASISEGNVGDVVVLTITPDKDYKISTVKVGETTIEAVDGVYSFELAAGVNNVLVVFAKKEYKPLIKMGNVVIAPSENGSITASKNSAEVGTTITLIASAQDGYEVDKVIANGKELTAQNGVYSFELLEGENNVSATFKELTKYGDVVVTKAGTGDGEVTPTTTHAEVGTNVTLIATPNAESAIEKVVINGTVVAAEEDGSYKFILIEGNNTVEVTFKLKPKGKAIMGFTIKDSISSFFMSKKEDNTEFLDKTAEYRIGDDNAFNFRPTVEILDLDTTDTTPSKEWPIEITVSYFNTEKGAYEVLDSAEKLAVYVEKYDKVTCDIDFTQEAVNHKFKLDYAPAGRSDKQIAEHKHESSLEFTVGDGMNIYSSDELGYINNDTSNINVIGSGKTKTGIQAWKDFRAAKGLPELAAMPKNLYIQKDLTITKDNFPSEYLINEDEIKKPSLIGLLNDEVSIYHRNFKENEEFNFEGNFFNIDASAIPVIGLAWNKDNENEYQVSHANMFKFNGSETAKVSMSNFKSLGNAPRIEDGKCAGGLIMTKVRGPQYSIFNNKSIGWFITHFDNNSLTPYTIEKCIATDAFNCFIYGWGGKDVTIKDSSFNGAGGPAIIQDHTGLSTPTPDDDVLPTTKLINSTLKSLVTGSEGWFQTMNALPLVPQIKFIDGVLNAFGKTFQLTKPGQKETYMNFMCLTKDGGAEEPTANFGVRGTFNDGAYSFDYGADDPLFQGTYKTVTGINEQAPFFETNAGGQCYFDGEKPVLVRNPQTPEAVAQEQAKMAGGDKVAIYYTGMMIVFETYTFKA